jgi:hypothetical protein
MSTDRLATPGPKRAMIRSIVAVVVGFVVWFVVATLGNILERLAIPGYADVERAMTFTLAMMIGRLAIGIASSLAAGAVAAAIGSPIAVRVLAVVMIVFFLPVHYTLWDRFPVWYHAFFLLSLAPAIWAGSLLVAKRKR